MAQAPCSNGTPPQICNPNPNPFSQSPRFSLLVSFSSTCWWVPTALLTYVLQLVSIKITMGWVICLSLQAYGIFAFGRSFAPPNRKILDMLWIMLLLWPWRQEQWARWCIIFIWNFHSIDLWGSPQDICLFSLPSFILSNFLISSFSILWYSSWCW